MTNNRGDKIIKEQADMLQVSFDKEAAWTRLQGRLESRDEKKIYYRGGWMVAAMMAIGMVLWYSMSETKQQVAGAPAKNSMPVRQESAEKTILVSRGEPIVAERIKKDVVVKRAPVKSLKPVGMVQPDLQPELAVSQTETVKEIPAIQEKEIMVAAPKPKMKVVHINEVMEEERVEQRMRNGRYAIEKIFPFQKPATDKQDHNYIPSKYKRSSINDPYEEYRLIQN